jgi:hypothetical protein
MNRDYTQAYLFIKDAFKQEKLSERYKILRGAEKTLEQNNKDNFYL